MPRLEQINVDVTPQVRGKLAQLESQLAGLKATKYEIVAVLLQRATRKSITASDLERYRGQHKAFDPRKK